MSKDTYPTLYVREGEQELAIPAAPNFFDPEQSRPVDDFHKWMDDFFTANVLEAGDLRQNDSRETWMDLNPTIAQNIIRIRRHLPQHRAKTSTHEVSSFARKAGKALHPLLRVERDLSGHEGVYHIAAGAEAETIPTHDQQAARDLIQRAMRPILYDLGYGLDHHEFTEKAVPLDVYRSERDIVYPPRFEFRTLDQV